MANQHLVVGPAAQLRALRQQAADLDEKITGAQLEQQRISAAIAEVRDAVQAREPDKRVMTTAERAQLTALTSRQATQRTLLTSLLEEKRTVAADLAAAEAANEAARNAPDPGPDADAYFSRLAAQRARLIPGGGDASPRSPKAWTPGTPFFANAGDLAGYETTRDYVASVVTGSFHPAARMQAASQSGDTIADGGALVPPQYENRLVRSIIERDWFLPGTQMFPMTASELIAPAMDDLDHSNTTFAGNTLQMTSAAGSVDRQVTKFRQIVLRARKSMNLVSIPNSLIADSIPNIDDVIGDYLAQVVAFAWVGKFLFGLGSNEPVGCLVAPCTITINRNTANKIIYDDITAMLARLTPASLERAIFVASSSTLPQLASLGIPIGTGGSHVPVLSNVNGARTILGVPLKFSEHAKQLGTASDLSLIDRAAYAVGIRQGATLAKSMHVGFETDELLMRIVQRMDGMPVLSSPITPANAGDTLSPFVTLGDPS